MEQVLSVDPRGTMRQGVTGLWVAPVFAPCRCVARMWRPCCRPVRRLYRSRIAEVRRRRVLPVCIRAFPHLRVDRRIGRMDAAASPTASLLIVDDDASVRAMLTEYLGNHGFSTRVAGDGAAMRAELERELPDLVLLDLRLPGEDGLTLARYLRERYDVGIVMVTGSGDIVDRVVGLELGADDYVAKPFDPRELLARVKSVLRRMQARPSTDVAGPAAGASPAGAEPAESAAPARRRFGRCEIELEARRLFDASADGAELPLTAMEYDLIRVFLANPNRVLSRDQLLMHTRNREWEPFDRSIDIRIGRLRRKIEPDPAAEPRVIRTVRNAGYMYVPAAA
jgi:two-component system phosphate regulon response regulator OmpR